MSINKISFLIIIFLIVATLMALGYLKNYNNAKRQEGTQFKKNENAIPSISYVKINRNIIKIFS
ncbi:MAG: hypothetical protein UR60_C0006G0012 [Candidatus Moranbacteria bacterium GW2011_GWF2_34_56]|nr:MAG: hypothetical protein UR51_C0005G0017 [Candidatus Moranbacteria bacterium GW2011_GWF1_34_10]KKP65190.1 MAG: hypothetical protein UR60_C0006G0012 [Candidatus Moranbacteria bacterium GW2011_GWF2_34_56]HBI16732.1 hypothetical protein [Candidatus Moranbacteria bacterium]